MNIVVFLSECRMDFIGRRYYKINIFLLDSLGLWPSQATKRVQILPIFIYTIFLSFLFVQFCTFLTSKYSMDLFLKVFSHVLPTLIYTVKYNAYYINAKKVKLLMDEVQNDWNALDDKKEIEIIEKYAYSMNFFTVIVTLSSCVGLIIFFFTEFLPITLDIIVPLNESRPRDIHVITEYFIDHEKYFFLILLHEILATFAGAITIVATGTIIMAYGQHTCGMLKIVSFRIERMSDKNMLQYSSLRVERIIYNRIVHAVDLHRKTLKFFDLILSTFAIQYSILIIIGVASIVLNVYRVSTILNDFAQLLQPSTRHDMTDLFTSIILISGHFLYMFMANYVGQIVTDHCDDIFNATCNVLWYIAPLSSQKTLLFLMHRMIKSLRPAICDMFVASLEGFATLSTTSLSYLTVIYSLQ